MRARLILSDQLIKRLAHAGLINLAQHFAELFEAERLFGHEEQGFDYGFEFFARRSDLLNGITRLRASSSRFSLDLFNCGVAERYRDPLRLLG
jgi:hypothetical protein